MYHTRTSSAEAAWVTVSSASDFSAAPLTSSADGELTTPFLLRYWHSTATYTIASEVSGGLQHLPPTHHPIYQWPRDLLKPDLVLLLTVSPEERMKRIEGRGLERTREEVELETDSIYRQK